MRALKWTAAILLLLAAAFALFLTFGLSTLKLR